MKKRTMNELRQTKEYQGSSEGWKYLDDLENTKEYKLSDQGGEYTVPHKGADPIQQERDYIEEAKIEIANKVVKHLDDVIFEMICEEMGKRYVFESQNYLTEAGYELFEEQWFEFYHEHHGDILAQIHNKLIY